MLKLLLEVHIRQILKSHGDELKISKWVRFGRNYRELKIGWNDESPLFNLKNVSI